MYNNKRFCRKHQRNFPVTIESQLEYYTYSYTHAERYSDLLNAWRHNKKWLSQLLEWVLPSFPTYSRHDASHAEVVLHNIEMLLGENVIRQLSATDCFLLLHTVYLHDIGMCITHEYRTRLLENDKEGFFTFLREEKHTEDMKEFADALLFNLDELAKLNAEGRNSKLDYRLRIYYGILFLMGDFRRKKHGSESGRLLRDWVKEPQKLGIGFSTSGIPNRFFYTIAQCAALHTSYDFNEIMELPRIDGGYAHDYIHPRFVAVLLQLGDALDLDNNRFHPLMEEMMGIIPHNSQIHLGKHRSIRHLSISPEQIRIDADCKNLEEMRQIQIECECIINILKELSYHWRLICPEDIHIILPTVKNTDIRLDNKKLDENLVNVKFEIQQEMAFHLLQGSNIYQLEKNVFLREVIQNAIDATKMQYWKDWQGLVKSENLNDYKNILPVSLYPIDIEMYLAAKNDRTVCENTEERFYCFDSKYQYDKWKSVHGDEHAAYGLLIRVSDHGVGISAKDVRTIADVGSSHKKYEGEKNHIPDWLYPTAEFGIGLQSIFLVTNTFSAYTHTRNGENFQIDFEATGKKGRGFINVMPVSGDKAKKEYGTTFEIFYPVNYDDRINGKECPEDIFQQIQYHDILEKVRMIRQEMVDYIGDIIGENLFPVSVKLYDFFEEVFEDYNSRLYPFFLTLYAKTDMDKPVREFSTKNSRRWKGLNRKTDYNMAENISNSNHHFWKGKVEQKADENNSIFYYYDVALSKLCIHDGNMNLFVCVGAQRIVDLIKKYRESDDEKPQMEKITIYYKGIRVTKLDYESDFNCIEYIDIKQNLENRYLALNRAEFTEQGIAFIQNEIFSKCRAMIVGVLRSADFCKKIANLADNLYFPDHNEYSQHNFVLGLLGMNAFVQVKGSKQHLLSPIYRDDNSESTPEWDKLVEELNKKITEEIHKGTKYPWVNSVFYNIEVSNLKETDAIKESNETNGLDNNTKNLAEIMHKSNHYAVVSHRLTKDSPWKEILIQVDTKSLDIYQKIMQLKTEENQTKRAELEQTLNQWAQNIFKASLDQFQSDVIEQETTNSKKYTHLLFKWMLENFPTVALFSTSDNCSRINLLHFSYTDSIYIDSRTKCATYDKILEKNTQQERHYATLSSTGFCQLALNNRLPQSVTVQTRGLIGAVGRRYMIIPFTNQTLKRLRESLNNNLYRQLAEIFVRVRDYGKDLLENGVKNNDKNNEKKLEDAIYEFLNNPDRKIEQSMIGSNFKDKMQEFINSKKIGEAPNLDCQYVYDGLNKNKTKLWWTVLQKDYPAEGDEDFRKWFTHFKVCWEKFRTLETGEYTLKNLELPEEFKKELEFAKTYYALPDGEADTEFIEKSTQAKRKLIHYVAQNSCIQGLKDASIQITYDAFIEDIFRSMVYPYVEKIIALHRDFGMGKDN